MGHSVFGPVSFLRYSRDIPIIYGCGALRKKKNKIIKKQILQDARKREALENAESPKKRIEWLIFIESVRCWQAGTESERKNWNVR